MNKSLSIELFRFLFTIDICLLHISIVKTSIAVEFFFVLSGFLLYNSFQRHHDLSTIDFTIKKIRAFFWPYLISMFLIMLLDRKQYFCLKEFTPNAILSTYFAHFDEFFFAQNLGFSSKATINGPMWYLSVLIFGGAFLFSLLKNYKHTAITVYIPILSIVGLTLILNTEYQGYCIPLSNGLIRGTSWMGLGVISAYLFKMKYYAILSHTKTLDYLSVLCIVALGLMSASTIDLLYLLVFFIPILLFACFTENSLINRLLHW